MKTNWDVVKEKSERWIARRMGEFVDCGNCPFRQSCGYKEDDIDRNCIKVWLDWLSSPAETE